MREDKLRAVLLIKALEETDRSGVLLPPADRTTATTAVQRDHRRALRAARSAPKLNAHALRLLHLRAVPLLEQIVARYPLVQAVLAPRGLRWVGSLALVLSLLLGFGLSALDGTRRIDILAFPLLGLIAWNLCVYAFVAFRWARAALRRKPPRANVLGSLVTVVLHSLQRRVLKSATHHEVLRAGLSRYLSEWAEIGGPLLMARVGRWLHLCAAIVGAGLIGGLYLRGMVLEYRAGWESTFLDAAQVQALLSLFYAPAAALLGTPLPDTDHIAALRVVAGTGGADAAPWIHLLATTALLYVVLPRLLLALLSTGLIWRRTLHPSVPANLTPYFQATFGMGDSAGPTVRIVPFAYQPDGESAIALHRLLSEVLGGAPVIDLQNMIPYGEEERLPEQLVAEPLPALVALLFNLAATPEPENHGVVIASTREALAQRDAAVRLLVLVDEGPYAARMGAEDGRLATRREGWRSFVAAYGLEAAFIDLRQGTAASDNGESAERLRSLAWQAAA